jgi:hypothetical protein
MAAPDPGPADSVDDKTREKFKAALARKRERQHASAQGVERDGSEKSHGAPGPTKPKPFRRKSI